VVTSFGVWPRDHYTPLQRSIVGVSHALLQFSLTLGPASSAKVSSWLKPLLHLLDQITSYVFPHTAEQDSQPTISLISMQVIPYRARGSTCCLGVSIQRLGP
jgi:hypothetical protein